MAHYAILDDNNIVTQVIVGKNEGDTNQDWELYYGAKRTSYNTHGGFYYSYRTEKVDGVNVEVPFVDDASTPFRKNYAGIGYVYDSVRDAFYAPQPFASWTLNDSTCIWEAPTAYPDDGNQYNWDEDTTSWLEVE